jgi:hypothetical protein
MIVAIIHPCLQTQPDREGSPLSEDPGLRAQLETLTVRLALLEHEADNWEHSERSTAEFIRYLRRVGLLPSTIT